MQVTVTYDNMKLAENQQYIERLVRRNPGEANGPYLTRATEEIVKRAVHQEKQRAGQEALLVSVGAVADIL